MILSVGQSHPKHFKIGSALIKAFEKTDHSHCFVSWRDENLDIRKVCESRGGGGRLITNYQFRSENKVVRIFQYEITPEKINALELWAWKNLRPYGYKHNLGLAIMIVKNGFYKTINSSTRVGNPFKDGNYSMNCVEMTAKAIEIATNIPLPGNIEDYDLNRLHNFNCSMLKLGKCKLASQELLDSINSKVAL